MIVPVEGKEQIVRLEGDQSIRLEGDQTMAAAGELKAALVRALEADGQGVCVDLDRVVGMDITTLQLLWAAEQAAAQGNRSFVSRPNASQRALARDAGFERFPGEPAAEGVETAEG